MNFFGIMLTKRLRQSEGKTKYRLAKDSGVSEPSVVSITNGKLRPSDRALIAFASVTAAIRYCVRQIYKLKNNKEVETNVPDV